jgi:RND family efflux transporter MFP subunit
VDYDEERVTFINTKFEGWIEKLYVDETGQHVNKGQPLFDVYSRELYEAQEEYLAAVRGMERVSDASEMVRQQARDLMEAAVTKLKYLDVSEAQIQELADTKEIRKNLTIHSPAEGIVTEKMALEGMYVKPGMKLYTIADLTRIWVYVDIYEYQLPWVSIGQHATMTLPYIPGETFEGTLVYIYPYLNERTRVIKVRLEFENHDLELKPGMFANIVIQSHLKDNALLIPREAYIDSGKRQVAFQYLGSGKFQPREIQVGVQAENGMVEVLHGLDAGDVIVTSGQFLLDAESKLKEAIAKMEEPDLANQQETGAGPMDHGMESTASRAAPSAGAAAGDETPVRPAHEHQH